MQLVRRWSKKVSNPLQNQFECVSNQIIDAKQKFGRTNDQITLLAVSKKQSAEKIKQLYQLGQRAFGESYLQEALQKIEQFSQQDIAWHFIGPLQSNKTKLIAEHFNWLQSLGALKHAQLLNKHRPAHLGPLNVLLQVNLNHEPSKSGVIPAELATFCQQVAQLPNLKIRGLMAIPKHTPNEHEQRLNFKAMYQLYQSFKERYQLDTLSMGMSSDFKAAIAEGTTMIRIGTDIFGERNG